MSKKKLGSTNIHLMKGALNCRKVWILISQDFAAGTYLQLSSENDHVHLHWSTEINHFEFLKLQKA